MSDSKTENKTLMDRTQYLVELLDKACELEARGEPVPEELESELTNALTAQADKIDRCATFMNRCDMESAWLDKEIEALQMEKRRIQNRKVRMEKLADLVLKKTGERKISGLKGHYIGYRRTSHVEIQNENEIPENYWKTTETKSINKAAIKKDLSQGVEIPGVSLAQREKVQIK